MKIGKAFAATVAAVAGAVVFATAGCAPDATTSSSASGTASSSKLVVAVPSNPEGLEPGTNLAEPIGSEIIANVFDTLVAWKSPGFTTLEGRLATGWTVSNNSTVFDFTLRDGVKFQDGTAFDAAAVKFSLERTLKLNSYVEATLGLIKSIDVASPTKVTITLSKPDPVFLSILAQPQSAIVSPTAVQKYGKDFDSHPVGTGPFSFVSATADTDVVLTANKDYFRGAPKLGGIVFRIIPDASTRRLELESGGVDIVHQQGQLAAVASEDIAALRKNSDIKITQVPSQIIRQLEFNNSATSGPFTDIRVRQAIAHAIDYDGLIKGVLGGTASRVYGPLTSNSRDFNPAVKDLAPKYDPALAKKLLAEAGVNPASLSTPIYTFQGDLWGAVATYIQANLAAIGIKAPIQQLEFPTLRARQTSGQFSIALDGRQPWYNDPDAHITIGYLSSLADTAMTFRMPKNAELDNLIQAAQQESNEKTRSDLYKQIQTKIVERVPGAYLFSPDLIVFERSNIKGLVINSAPPLNEYWGVSKG
ncbi:MAG: ABC transporter substrate-binding protein [Gordonia sp. (in: high G+C Gram-positive bacteria)]